MKFREIIKYNRTAGIIALILVILISVFADANLALNSERKDVRKAYKNADFPTVIEKCSDEMRMLCNEAAKLGVYTERGLEAANTLEAGKKKPDGSYEALASVYAYAVSIGGELKTNDYPEDETTSLTLTAALKHYDALGQQLYNLSNNASYNKEAEEYKTEANRPLCRLLAPWFDETVGYTELYARYKDKFPNIKTESQPEINLGLFDELIENLGQLTGGVIGVAAKILSGVVRVVAAIVGWFGKHLLLTVVIIVILLIKILGNSQK